MAEIRASVKRNAADIGGAVSKAAKFAEETRQTLMDEIQSDKLTDLIAALDENENVTIYTKNGSRYLFVFMYNI